jgi:hypothetical protein
MPRPPRQPSARLPHRYEWLWEPLADDATFVLRSMFGAKAVYLDGKMVFCFSAGEEPWRGVLVCTSHESHAALQAEFTILKPHPILPKWLYLPETADAFEAIATKLVALARRRDPRIGITPKPRKHRKATSRRGLIK